ncbi:MAG TPA: hypothetical protein DCL29_03765, partial [Eubacterium sp.]|nr:hypothetical protein [Eubacterium sp.]
LRHELIALQVKLDTLTKENADYNKRVVEYQKRLIKIETMMENSVSAPVSVETTVDDSVEEKPKKTRVRKTTVKKETVETPLEIMAKEASVDEEEKPKKRTRRTTKKTDTPVEE